MQIDKSNPVVVYDTKPATEWLMGGPVQKVSPRYAHALMQRLVGEALGAWANGRGRVGPEWRVWISPGEEYARYLVPDIAFVSYERVPREAREAAEEPHVAPDVAVEIRSRDDRNIYVLHKVDVYLRAGTELVVIVDPYARTVTAHDREQMRVYVAGQTFTHDALPGFSLDIGCLFAKLDD